MKAKFLFLRLANNFQNTIIDKHTLDYQPFLKIPHKHQVRSTHVPTLSLGGGGKLGQKSHANVDIPKKQLKKCI